MRDAKAERGVKRGKVARSSLYGNGRNAGRPACGAGLQQL